MTSELHTSRAPDLLPADCAGRGTAVILGILVGLCFSAGILDAQVSGGIRIPEGVGPLLVGFEEKVYRDEDNKILLSKGRKGQRANLVYSIFVAPEHGQLQLQPESGVATYRTNPDLNPNVLEDRFEFRVRDAGNGDKGGFSAAVEVKLMMTGRNARLEVPDLIDFGKVVIGGEQTRELFVVNKGDAVFSGKATLPNGFQVNGKEEVQLNIGAGLRQSLMIRFLGKKRPEKGRVFFQLQPAPSEARVALVYEVNPAFQVQDKITLVFDDESFTRNAELRIANPFADKVKVRMVFPERMRSNSVEHEIPGNSTKVVRLRIPEQDAAIFSGSVTITGKGLSKNVRVSAEECPARVVLVGLKKDEPLLFKGMLDASADSIPDGFKRNVELRNVGGRPANLSLRVNPPFHLIGGSDPREIKPGESIICPVELRPGKVGPVSESLNIDYAGTPLVVNLRGQALLPPGTSIEQGVPPPEWRGNKEGNDTVVQGIALREILHGRNGSRRKFDATVPPVRKIRIIEQRSGSLVIAWNAPEGGNWRYVFEALVSRRDERTGFPVQTWVEIKPEHLILTRDGPEVRAEIVGIAPGGEFQFRILTLNDQGDSSLPATLRLAVKGKAGSFEWFRIWMLPLAGLVVAIVFSAVRRIRHERELYG